MATAMAKKVIALVIPKKQGIWTNIDMGSLAIPVPYRRCRNDKNENDDHGLDSGCDHSYGMLTSV